jgi:hypothetical protein
MRRDGVAVREGVETSRQRTAIGQRNAPVIHAATKPDGIM